MLLHTPGCVGCTSCNPHSLGTHPILGEVIGLMVAFRFYVTCFVAIPGSALMLYISAKIAFTRAILIETIGGLSYKYYIGDGSNAAKKND